MTSDPGPCSGLSRLPRPRGHLPEEPRETLPTFYTLLFPGREQTWGTGFSVPCWVGMGFSPGRRLRRRIWPLDSLFAFRQEVCWEPAGQPGERGFTITVILGPLDSLDWGGNGAPWGRSKELAQNVERKAWLKGTSLWLGIPSHHRHSPLSWALGTLSRTVQPPYQCPQSIPMWVTPKANVQASAGQWHQGDQLG